MLIGSRHSPRSQPPLRVTLEPRPLPSAGITPLPRYYGPLRHLPARTGPRGFSVGVCAPPSRASRVGSTPLRVHAVASTPAETTGHSRSRPLAVPVAGSLLRDSGGSASALTVSRPARRSLTLRPARSLSRPRRPFFTEVLQSISLPPGTAPIATGWNEQLTGRVYPPLGCGAFARRTGSRRLWPELEVSFARRHSLSISHTRDPPTLVSRSSLRALNDVLFPFFTSDRRTIDILPRTSNSRCRIWHGS